MKILVIHEPGPLGQQLLTRLRETTLDFQPVLLSQPDEVEAEQLQQWLDPETDLIVNALTMDDPELAEREAEMTRHRLLELPAALAKAAASANMIMLQLSSCYVFDGRKQQPYIASNPGQPLGFMGQMQWECEQMLRATLTRHLILRTGWSLRRFCEKILANEDSEAPLYLSDQCRGQPLSVWDLARVMVAMVEQLACGAEVWGTYQYASAQPVSLYELGLEIVDQLDPEVRPRLVDEMAPWAALEPTNAVLNCKKIRHTFGIQQLPWRNYLEQELAWPRQEDESVA